jgi:transposase
MSRRRSLTAVQVRAIRRMYENHMSIAAISESLGIARSTVQEVASWKTYTDVRTPGVVPFEPRSGKLMAYKPTDMPGVFVAVPLPVDVDRASR